MFKYVLGFFGVLIVVGLFLTFARTIFPYVEYDEYFVDKYGGIHGKYCPREDSWFTIKYSKYDILIERDQSICDECLLLEEDKLFMLHKYNLKERILYLKREGASEEYIRDELSSYRID